MSDDNEGFNFEDLPPPEPYEVTCARCGKVGTTATFYLEEGDEWECPPCWERREKAERVAAKETGE